MLNLILIAYPVTVEDKQKQKMRKQHVVSPGRKVAFLVFLDKTPISCYDEYEATLHFRRSENDFSRI